MLHNEPVQTLPLNNIVLQEVSQRVAEVDRVTRKSGQSVMHNLAYWVEFTVWPKISHNDTGLCFSFVKCFGKNAIRLAHDRQILKQMFFHAVFYWLFCYWCSSHCYFPCHVLRQFAVYMCVRRKKNFSICFRKIVEIAKKNWVWVGSPGHQMVLPLFKHSDTFSWHFSVNRLIMPKIPGVFQELTKLN